jgi:hypothetical protein
MKTCLECGTEFEGDGPDLSPLVRVVIKEPSVCDRCREKWLGNFKNLMLAIVTKTELLVMAQSIK